ncbi:putative Late embryoproteinsis abundant protein group 8 protein [Hibiscus syriacus]|uniref:Late embryoproteinsis abundant protein group 8 protein n=1 Tax=Hibiscus syriacus TaxID=106335 RepID=A0A6A2Z8L6_HIBSY|nr:putative Late embryoproteinsis abundant protein group 8 protein [Hibiscus syriacus]
MSGASLRPRAAVSKQTSHSIGGNSSERDRETRKSQSQQPTLSRRALSQTLTWTANLANLLPTGTLLAFQLLVPVFTNNGSCDPATRAMTLLLLLLLLTLSCFLACFTDSVEASDGRVYSYRLKFIDGVHAVLSVFVFGAVALRDKNVLNCFYPAPEHETEEVLSIAPMTRFSWAPFAFFFVLAVFTFTIQTAGGEGSLFLQGGSFSSKSPSGTEWSSRVSASSIRAGKGEDIDCFLTIQLNIDTFVASIPSDIQTIKEGPEFCMKDTASTNAAFDLNYVLLKPLPTTPVTTPTTTDATGDETTPDVVSTFAATTTVVTATKNTKMIWEMLEKKYGVDDAGIKKYVVGEWMRFHMADDKSIMDQVHDYKKLVSDIIIEGMQMCEVLQDNELVGHMKIEEANRLKDKVTNSIGQLSFKDNLVESGKPKAEGKSFKCYVCGLVNHKAYQCQHHSDRQNVSKPQLNVAENNIDDVISTVVSGVIFLENNTKWVVDTGTFMHFYAMREFFTEFEDEAKGERCT